ncbi:MAG: hypothetical protein QOK42_1696 [Frankiaceae bacterium]|jgi:hypothetical protein|nr:hypothetical protein [Frankiaceae bacterium]MDX6225668.1 hypothetical protein [Frankiales bacterium]MDX6275257.1 hypothetical protein [Frankiales bacterium]
MIDPYLTYNGVRSHIDDLRDEACLSRLAALATCCKPTAWSRVRDLLGKPAS